MCLIVCFHGNLWNIFCLYIFRDEEITKKQLFKKQFYSDNLGLKTVRLFVKSL